jgi:hypothetical protein
MKQLGATTSLHFLVQERQIRADAVVRHVKPGDGLRLKFQAVSEKDRPNLAALMKRLRSLPQQQNLGLDLHQVGRRLGIKLRRAVRPAR